METLYLVLLLAFVSWLVFGRGKSDGDRRSGQGQSASAAIPDRYRTLEEVSEALRKAGLESSNLIIGIDYTKSNEYNGRRTFGGRSLHEVDPRGATLNPYERVIQIIGRTLEPFDDDKLIHVFGFGDSVTTNRGVMPFYPDRLCYRFTEVHERYREITPLLTLSGPTNFAPLIRHAISIVKESNNSQFYILVIIADGQVTQEKDTIAAIIEASDYPLSIIMVGVGDGPWDMMQEFDDNIPRRRFDNFQFVNFHDTVDGQRNPDVRFAVNALMEIPDQFRAIRSLKLFG